MAIGTIENASLKSKLKKIVSSAKSGKSSPVKSRKMRMKLRKTMKQQKKKRPLRNASSAQQASSSESDKKTKINQSKNKKSSNKVTVKKSEEGKSKKGSQKKVEPELSETKTSAASKPPPVKIQRKKRLTETEMESAYTDVFSSDSSSEQEVISDFRSRTVKTNRSRRPNRYSLRPPTAAKIDEDSVTSEDLFVSKKTPRKYDIGDDDDDSNSIPVAQDEVEQEEKDKTAKQNRVKKFCAFAQRKFSRLKLGCYNTDSESSGLEGVRCSPLAIKRQTKPRLSFLRRSSSGGESLIPSESDDTSHRKKKKKTRKSSPSKVDASLHKDTDSEDSLDLTEELNSRKRKRTSNREDSLRKRLKSRFISKEIISESEESIKEEKVEEEKPKDEEETTDEKKNLLKRKRPKNSCPRVGKRKKTEAVHEDDEKKKIAKDLLTKASKKHSKYSIKKKKLTDATPRKTVKGLSFKHLLNSVSGDESEKPKEEDKNLFCNDCGLSFGSLKSREDHRQDCRNIAFEMSLMAEDLYECPHCHLTFAMKGTQRQHSISCRVGGRSRKSGAQRRPSRRSDKLPVAAAAAATSASPEIPKEEEEPLEEVEAASDTPSIEKMPNVLQAPTSPPYPPSYETTTP